MLPGIKGRLSFAGDIFDVMPEKVAVILNAAAGSVSGEETRDALAALLSEQGFDADFHFAETGSALLRHAEQVAAGPAQVVIAAGGDGTVSAVASRLIDTEKTLAVIPMGTLNNFSKDLGIPQNAEEAVRVIAEREPSLIDVGEVNGRYFINNSSIGLYPRIVRKRVQNQRLGHGKWWAALWAAWRFLWITPFFRVRLHLSGRVFYRKTPFVFVGNNDYEMDFYNIGRRLSLNRGNLSIYLLHRSGRAGLFLLVLRTLFGRLRQAKDFEELQSTELEVVVRRRGILVACDGEIEVMATPLRYKIHPRALRVISAV